MHHADGFLYVFGGNDSTKSFKKVLWRIMWIVTAFESIDEQY